VHRDLNGAFAAGAVTLEGKITQNSDAGVELGTAASVNNTGSFVFADGTGGALASTTDHQFLVRASGGATIYSSSNLTTGVSLAPGAGAWADLSDRNLKTNFEALDTEKVLQSVATIPVLKWSYKAQDATIRHIGPMAQDFYSAFGLAGSNTTITTTDIDGVNMAAIQALIRRTDAMQARITELEATILRLKAQNQ
jgi:hypothetical protein